MSTKIPTVRESAALVGLLRRNACASAWLGLWAVLAGCLFFGGQRSSELERAALAGAPVGSGRARTVNIEHIRPGDFVLAWDEETGELAPRRVLQAVERTTYHLRILGIEAADGSIQQIHTTDEHPFWVIGEGWVDAGNLSLGDQVRQSDGSLATIASTTYEPHPEGVLVYNLEVEDYHSYFASSHLARAPPVLVHNGVCPNLPVHSRYPDGTPVFEGMQPPRISGPDPDAVGPHTILRWDPANGRIYQAREFDVAGNPLVDIDFTSPTFPDGRLRPGHPGPPHIHQWLVNDPLVGPPSGLRRGPSQPF